MANLIGVGVDARPRLTKTVKREDVYVNCKFCDSPKIVTHLTVGFICSNCNKYNSVSENDKTSFGVTIGKVPLSHMPHIRSTEMDNYIKFRDEHQIRSDLYQKGITRAKLGPLRFNKLLKKELIANHCYRGKDSHVD